MKTNILIMHQAKVTVLIKIQLDATVCSLIYFTAKSLYMFRVLEGSSCTDIMTCTGGCVSVFGTPDDGCGGHPKHVE